MFLYHAMLSSFVILQQTRRFGERPGDGQPHVLLGRMLAGFSINDQFFARYGNIDPDLEQVTMFVVAVRNVDDYPTDHDMFGEYFENRRDLVDRIFDLVRMRHVPKTDLQRQLHF